MKKQVRGLINMPGTKARIIIGASALALLLCLALPRVCSCPMCLVAGAKPRPCECTALGVYLGRKALRALSLEAAQACDASAGRRTTGSRASARPSAGQTDQRVSR
jgi:hypothetical protein